jgi:hypothetical protein
VLNYHELILKKVNESSGIKQVELALAVMTEIGPGRFDNHSFQHELEYAISHGEIIELEYVVPQTSYKMSSLYFPKGTEFPQWQK